MNRRADALDFRLSWTNPLLHGTCTGVAVAHHCGRKPSFGITYRIESAVERKTVEIVRHHNIGNRAGDAIELEALEQVFQEARPGGSWCALGSIKSQVGHTKAAAGAAGLFKAIMALHHKVLPPPSKIDRPNPKLDIGNSPFYLNLSQPIRRWHTGTIEAIGRFRNKMDP